MKTFYRILGAGIMAWTALTSTSTLSWASSLVVEPTERQDFSQSSSMASSAPYLDVTQLSQTEKAVLHAPRAITHDEAKDKIGNESANKSTSGLQLASEPFTKTLSPQASSLIELEFPSSSHLSSPQASSSPGSHRFQTLMPFSSLNEVSHLSLDPLTHQVRVYKKPDVQDRDGDREGNVGRAGSPPSYVVLSAENITNLPWGLEVDRLQSFVLQHTARLLPLKDTYTLDFTGSLKGGSHLGQWRGVPLDSSSHDLFNTQNIINNMAPRLDTYHQTMSAITNNYNAPAPSSSFSSGSFGGNSHFDAFQRQHSDRDFARVGSLPPQASASSRREAVLRSLEVPTSHVSPVDRFTLPSASLPYVTDEMVRALEALGPLGSLHPSASQHAQEPSFQDILRDQVRQIHDHEENQRREKARRVDEGITTVRRLIDHAASSSQMPSFDHALSQALDVGCAGVNVLGKVVPVVRSHPAYQAASIGCGVRSAGKAVTAVSTPAARPTISTMASKPATPAPYTTTTTTSTTVTKPTPARSKTPIRTSRAKTPPASRPVIATPAPVPVKPTPAPAKHVGSHQPIYAPNQLPAFPEAKLINRINNRKTWLDKKYYYQEDTLHGTVEKYYKGSELHVGEYNYNTGVQTKRADPTKKLRKP